MVCRMSAALFALAALSGGSAWAQTPVAMVEDIRGTGLAVEELDYLSEGQTIAVPANASITIGYFRSCQRETIAGGTVTIGAELSQVAGGVVKRERVECDGGRMLLSAEQASKSGVIAMRGAGARRDPQFVLFSTSPVIEMPRPGGLFIRRLDENEPDIELNVVEKQLVRGRFFDLATVKARLQPGGIYRIMTDDGAVTVKVDPESKSDKTSLIARLVKL
jgi:hypothetical protein